MTIYTVTELAEILKTDDDNVRKLIHSEQIESFKLGREYRITEKAMIDFINKNKIGGKLK